MAKSMKTLFGIAAASAAAGAVASMFLSPKSGREMRESVKGKIKNGKEAASDKISSVKEKISD